VWYLIKISVERMPGTEDIPLPAYATPGSAGMDLLAALPDTATIEPGRCRLIPTGLRIAIPVGYEGQVRPRSGLALKQGLTILNAPGTIDSDYRGEIGVILVNLGEAPVKIERGQRIAQLILARVERAEWVLNGSLTSTERGEEGFGHTGK